MAIALGSRDTQVYLNRGTEWEWEGEYGKAIADMNDAIRLDPGHAWALAQRAHLWESKGDFDHAIADCIEAIGLDPRYTPSYVTLGNAWRGKGEFDVAISAYSEAIRFDPRLPMAYNNRGVAWEKKGTFDQAVADFQAAIRPSIPRTPSSPVQQLLRLAHRHTCPDARYRDGKKSRPSVGQLARLPEPTGWKEWPSAFDTLAAAYAEAGDFDAAVKVAGPGAGAELGGEDPSKSMNDWAYPVRWTPGLGEAGGERDGVMARSGSHPYIDATAARQGGQRCR